MAGLIRLRGRWIAAAGGAAALLATAPVSAAPDEETLQIKDARCVLLASDRTVFATEDVQHITVFSAGGPAHDSCHAMQPAHIPRPERAVRLTGADLPIQCGVVDPRTGVLRLTRDWVEIITPSGRVNLSCRIPAPQ